MSWQIGGVCGLFPAGLCRSSASLEGLEWAGRGEFLRASAQGRVSFSPCSGEGSAVEEKRQHHLFLQPSIHSSPLMSGCLQGAGSRRWKKGKQFQLVLTGNSSLRLGAVMVHWKDGRGGNLRLAHVRGGDPWRQVIPVPTPGPCFVGFPSPEGKAVEGLLWLGKNPS